MIIYSGIFFEKEKIDNIVKSKLAKDIKFPHITFKFKPAKEDEELLNSLVGEEVNVYLYNFKQDENNAGFYVAKIESDNKYINDLFEYIECPHITTSVSEFGKPVDTYKLFSKKCPIEEELFVVIKGTFGNFIKPGYPVFK